MPKPPKFRVRQVVFIADNTRIVPVEITLVRKGCVVALDFAYPERRRIQLAESDPRLRPLTIREVGPLYVRRKEGK